MTGGWWCPICATTVVVPSWTSPVPAPYHLLGASMHAVRPLRGQPTPPPVDREWVVREAGRYRTERLTDVPR